MMDDPINRTMSRAQFEATYVPISCAAHRRAAVRAFHRETYGPPDVLVEECGEGMVRLLPPDLPPYHWRTMWRRREEPPERRFDTRQAMQ
jgi:hypothetical protein